jgi:hypothetical protein
LSRSRSFTFAPGELGFGLLELAQALLLIALEAARNETVLGIDSAIAAFVDHAFLSHEFAAHAGGVRYSHEERSPGSPITPR